jgi:hypothetical protein
MGDNITINQYIAFDIMPQSSDHRRCQPGMESKPGWKKPGMARSPETCHVERHPMPPSQTQGKPYKSIRHEEYCTNSVSRVITNSGLLGPASVTRRCRERLHPSCMQAWFGSNPFDPNQVVRTTAGSATLTFSDANNGVLTYTRSMASR